MPCSNSVCGTGEFEGPKPGDPNSPSAISAVTVPGGINVSWHYPTLNPAAVAYTIVYRAGTAQFADAVRLGEVGGSLYFDRISVTVDTPYWYWIQVVSVNGTPGEVIGPAHAIARPLAQQTLETLTGLIDSGVLAQALRTRIDGFDEYGRSLTDEIHARLLANEALAAALARVQSGLDEAMTFLSHEVTRRTDGDSALLQVIDVQAVANQANLAAIVDERTTRVTENEAIAQALGYLYAQVGLDIAAAIETNAEAIANSDGALTKLINTSQTQVLGNLSTVQEAQSTWITQADGHITSIGALYTAKVQVNGLIGGFGVYNDGTLVEAGFDVDRFWIGRTGPDRVKPFIVDGGIVYMDEARIRTAAIDTLKLDGQAVIHSAGNVAVNNSSNSVTVGFTVSGLADGEWIPVHISAGIDIPHQGEGISVISHTNPNGTYELHAGQDDNSYVGAIGYTPNGYNQVTLSINNSAMQSSNQPRRLSLLVQGIKR